MVLREKDDADYYYNTYRENPTQENLDQLIKYRPQDNYDQINKRVALESIREEIKSNNNKEGKELTEKDFGFPKMVEKTNIIIEKAEEKKMSFKIKERKDILVKEIILSTKNPRKHFRGAGMEELKDSIKKTGLIQPILIKEIGNNHYEAIAGNRRLFAFQELKKETIPVIIIEADSEIAESDIALIENLVRDDLSPIEEARAYINRWELMGHKSTENFQYQEVASALSKELPKSYNSIHNKLSLLKLPEKIQNAIHLGKFKKTYGYELSRLPTQEQIMEYYRKLTNKGHQNGWTVAKLKEEINEILKEEEEKTEQIKKIKLKTLDNLKKNLENKREVRNKHLQDFLDVLKTIRSTLKEDLKGENIPKNILKTLQTSIKQEKKNVEFRWKEIQKEVDNAQKRVNSIDALLDQVEQLDISVCPYCEAGIDIEVLQEKQQKLRENIEDLEKEQLNINANLKQFQKNESNFKNIKGFLEKSNSEIKIYLHDIIQSRKEIRNLEDK